MLQSKRTLDTVKALDASTKGALDAGRHWMLHFKRGTGCRKTLNASLHLNRIEDFKYFPGLPGR
jgi:hypothetical protein